MSFFNHPSPFYSYACLTVHASDSPMPTPSDDALQQLPVAASGHCPPDYDPAEGRRIHQGQHLESLVPLAEPALTSSTSPEARQTLQSSTHVVDRPIGAKPDTMEEEDNRDINTDAPVESSDLVMKDSEPCLSPTSPLTSPPLKSPRATSSALSTSYESSNVRVRVQLSFRGRDC